MVEQIALSGAGLLPTRQMLESVRKRTGIAAKVLEKVLSGKRRDVRQTSGSAASDWIGRMILTDSGEPRQSHGERRYCI